MTTRLFDSTLIREAKEAMEFMANVLESSTEYSIIGKDLDGNILLWNEGARRMYGYE
jgi:PAS domain S-box-containing protein